MKSEIPLEQTIDSFLTFCNHQKFKTILADPPWQFKNRTGKVAPEHKRLNRYPTMTLEDIMKLPVSHVTESCCHLYLWVPNALLPDGLAVMQAWGFEYKTITEILLFGIKGKGYRTLAPARSQVNLIRRMKQEHSRKPDVFYSLIETCSEGPYLEMFARGIRKNWFLWGNQANDNYVPDWTTYKNNSSVLSAINDDLFCMQE